MTGATEDMAPEGDDLLAAEYVLGVLALPDRSTVERRLRNDTALAGMVTGWEDRLSPLNDGYAEVQPPGDLLARIEARLFPAAAAAPRSAGRFWVGLFGGALTAAAIALAVFLQFPTPEPSAPALVATLAGDGQPLVFAARYDETTDLLVVERTAGEPAAAGSDYELWVIDGTGVPASLGVIREATVTTTLADLAPGFVLAVSLEAAGGSATGAPTTVLVTGAVAAEAPADL